MKYVFTPLYFSKLFFPHPQPPTHPQALKTFCTYARQFKSHPCFLPPPTLFSFALLHSVLNFYFFFFFWLCPPRYSGKNRVYSCDDEQVKGVGGHTGRIQESFQGTYSGHRIFKVKWFIKSFFCVPQNASYFSSFSWRSGGGGVSTFYFRIVEYRFEDYTCLRTQTNAQNRAKSGQLY